MRVGWGEWQGGVWDLSMLLVIPGCRIRVWRRGLLQTAGSQTSFATGTIRTADRGERRRGEWGEIGAALHRECHLLEPRAGGEGGIQDTILETIVTYLQNKHVVQRYFIDMEN